MTVRAAEARRPTQRGKGGGGGGGRRGGGPQRGPRVCTSATRPDGGGDKGLSGRAGARQCLLGVWVTPTLRGSVVRLFRVLLWLRGLPPTRLGREARQNSSNTTLPYFPYGSPEKKKREDDGVRKINVRDGQRLILRFFFLFRYSFNVVHPCRNKRQAHRVWCPPANRDRGEKKRPPPPMESWISAVQR